MRFDNRGMASVELIFITLIVLVIMAGMLSLISTQLGMTNTGNVAKMRIAGENMVTSINTVYVNGNGYSIDMQLPDDQYIEVNVINTGSDSYLTIYNNEEVVNLKLIPKRFYSNYTMYNSYVLGYNPMYRITNNNGTLNITQI